MNIIGIDVSKSKLDCALIDNSTHRKLKLKVVSNSVEGFVTLIDWLAKRTKSSISSYHFIMEATGVYHEKCTYWLFDSGARCNPPKIRTDSNRVISS